MTDQAPRWRGGVAGQLLYTKHRGHHEVNAQSAHIFSGPDEPGYGCQAFAESRIVRNGPALRPLNPTDHQTLFKLVCEGCPTRLGAAIVWPRDRARGDRLHRAASGPR